MNLFRRTGLKCHQQMSVELVEENIVVVSIESRRQTDRGSDTYITTFQRKQNVFLVILSRAVSEL